MARLSNTRTIDQWSDHFRNHGQTSVDAIIAIGRDLEQSRAELGAAKFAQMYRDKLKWGQSTVSRYMVVADDDKLSEYLHANILPASLETLYALTRLDPEQFNAGVESGIIHQGMMRKDIKQLLPEKPKKEKPSRVASNPSIDRAVSALRASATETMQSISEADWPALILALREEVEALAQIAYERAKDAAA